jgi:hypothetical protein
MKNNRFHRGIGMTPFEALYGRKIASLPTFFREEPTEKSDQETVRIPTSVESNLEVSDDQLPDDENRELLDLSHSAMQKNLEEARNKQQKQADGMLKSTAMRYGEVEKGTTVRIPVPQVDRSKVDPRNVLARVMGHDNGT